MPDIVGVNDPDEVKRARAKYLAIQRTKRRLENRLADIDWEYDVLKPGLERLEKRITVVGELPSVDIGVDEDGDEFHGRADSAKRGNAANVEPDLPPPPPPKE